MQSCDLGYYKRINFNVIFVSWFFFWYLFHMFYLLSFGNIVVNQFTSCL